MIRLKEGWVYEPTVIDGWIVRFIPNLSENEPKVNYKFTPTKSIIGYLVLYLFTRYIYDKLIISIVM